MTTTMRAFRNALCILISVDMHEMVEAGVVTDAQWPAFRDDPYRAYLRLDDEREERCWALIQSRMPEALRAEMAVPA